MANKGKVKLDYRDNLIGASFAFAGMNFMVDPADLPIENGQCVDICNCDIDFAANISRRDGYVLESPQVVTSAWANSNNRYCVQFGKICTYNGSVVAPFSNSPIVKPEVEFKQVNNLVVYSDGLVMGIIDNNNLFVFNTNIVEIG